MILKKVLENNGNLKKREDADDELVTKFLKIEER